MDRMNRRKFVLGGAAAIAAGSVPKQVDSTENPLTFFPSPLTAEELEKHKQSAIASLKASVPNDPKVAYLHEHTRHLAEESQMYIPDEQELKSVTEKSMPELKTLSSRIPAGSAGIFIYADADEKKGNVQRLYVVLKDRANALRFLKSYRVSMSEAGFGNIPDSGQTPLGLHTIHSGKRGLFGEVVSEVNPYRSRFNRIVLNGKEHWFVKSFGERAPDKPYNDAAEVVTDQYLLVGPRTDTSRGIRIHGTNRSGYIGPNGKWISFLGGVRRSGGCIRMSNTDVRDLTLSGYLWTPQSPDRNNPSRTEGTPVMIYATEKGRRLSGPTHWKPPKDAKTPAEQPTQKTEEEPKKQKLPGRWQSPDQDVKRSPAREAPLPEEIKRKNWPGRWQPPSE